MRAKGIVSVLAGLGIATAGLVYVPAAQAVPNGCANRTNNSVRKLLECVTVEGVLEHQEALQDIADENGGNRAGHAGYDASVDYVADRLEAAGYESPSRRSTSSPSSESAPPPCEQIAPATDHLRRGHRLRAARRSPTRRRHRRR